MAVPVKRAHNRRMPFDATTWERVFARLAEELPGTEERHVTLIGGVAMALGYGSRRTTADADAIEVRQDVSDAADRIADEFGLPKGWLNQRATDAGFLVHPDADHPVRRWPKLVLSVPSAERMLAMKLARFAGDVDTEDAKTLLPKLRAQYCDVEMAWDVIGGFVPVAERAKARYYLLGLWEELDEPA